MHNISLDLGREKWGPRCLCNIICHVHQTRDTKKKNAAVSSLVCDGDCVVLFGMSCVGMMLQLNMAPRPSACMAAQSEAHAEFRPLTFDRT